MDTAAMLMTGEVSYWTDGRYVLSTRYDLDKKKIVTEYRHHSNQEYVPTQEVLLLNVDGDKVVEDAGSKLSVMVEQVGQYTMLVYRDEQGNPVKAFYHLAEKDWRTHSWQDYIFINYILAGNYNVGNEHHAVFGPKMDFYEGNQYDRDPGAL